MGLCLVDIDMVEKIVVHEIAVALIVIGSERVVFVEIVGSDILEGDLAVFVHFGKVFVHTHGRGTGSKAENAVRLGFEKSRDYFGALAGHFVIVFANDEFHCKFLRYFFVTQAV